MVAVACDGNDKLVIRPIDLRTMVVSSRAVFYEVVDESSFLALQVSSVI